MDSIPSIVKQMNFRKQQFWRTYEIQEHTILDSAPKIAKMQFGKLKFEEYEIQENIIWDSTPNRVTKMTFKEQIKTFLKQTKSRKT